MTKTGKIELMSPAGDFACLQAAIDNGADSVYFGVEQLNMRARSTVNFTLEDLDEVARRCNENGVRTYLTLNTIIYDHDLSIVKKLLDKAKQAGITAVIAMDQAVIAYARQIGMEVHIPTHTIYIEVGTQNDIKNLVKNIKANTQRMMNADKDNEPYFCTKPTVTVAKKMTNQQYDKGWQWIAQKPFRTAFTADEMILLKKTKNSNYIKVSSFNFNSIKSEVLQGVLFNH